jgi:hypothetical protein
MTLGELTLEDAIHLFKTGYGMMMSVALWCVSYCPCKTGLTGIHYIMSACGDIHMCNIATCFF